MSYKNKLQYTDFQQRGKKILSSAPEYLREKSSQCEESTLCTKRKELKYYMRFLLKKVRNNLFALRGVFLLSVFMLYYCSGDPKMNPPPTNPLPNTTKTPLGFRAVASGNQVTLFWMRENDLTYNLYWSTTSGMGVSGQKIANVTSPHVHSGLTNNTTYYYVLTAKGGDADESLATAEVEATLMFRIFVANGGVNKVYRRGREGEISEFVIDHELVHFSGNSSSQDYVSEDIALGDLDGDGYLDVVVANHGADETNVFYLNDGEGGFDEGSEIFSDRNNAKGIALGDLDGDGDLDIVVANYRQTNKFYLNNGMGGFDAGSDISSSDGGNESNDIALGDLDGDGDLDVVVANRSRPNRVYLNNGVNDGMVDFDEGSDISSDERSSQGIALGDLDGDGDLDVVIANYYNAPGYGINRFYLNNGLGGFNEGFDISPDDDHESMAIALGDLDGDGDLDVVVANYYETINKFYLNNGVNNDGMLTFHAGSDISFSQENSTDIALVDLDGDGYLDVVVANYYETTNRFYLNNGMGGFDEGVQSPDIYFDEDDSNAIAVVPVVP